MIICFFHVFITFMVQCRFIWVTKAMSVMRLFPRGFYVSQSRFLFKLSWRHQMPNSLTKSWEKSWEFFLLAIHTHLFSFDLRNLFLQTHATSSNFLNSRNKIIVVLLPFSLRLWEIKVLNDSGSDWKNQNDLSKNQCLCGELTHKELELEYLVKLKKIITHKFGMYNPHW